MRSSCGCTHTNFTRFKVVVDTRWVGTSLPGYRQLGTY